MTDNANNGMITKIWGPPMWIALHTISFGYPLEPNDEQKENYKNFFKLIADILPCRYCRESYLEFINEEGSILNDDVMNNRETLSRWLYNLHNKVNNKLGIDYGVTYENVRDRYESYRAKCSKSKKETGCIMPLDDKSNSYKIADVKDCPIISNSTVDKFSKYARKRGIHNTKYINIDRDSELWEERNKKCELIIKHMQKNGIPSIEPDSSKWRGLPTRDELKLIMMSSSNLSEEVLKEISLDKVKVNIKKYRLVR